MSATLKFWLLTTEYPPQSGGGISTYCWHTAKMLASADIEVTVFIPAPQSQFTKVVDQEQGIRLVYFRQDGNPENKFLGWEAALSFQFSKVLKEFADREGEPDYIESQEYNGIAYYALQRRLLEKDYLSNCRFFITAHAPGFLYLDYNQAPSYQIPEFWIGEMEKAVLKAADFVISPSQYLLDQLVPYLDMKDVATKVLRNPFVPFDLATDYVPYDYVFFGKMTPQKGAMEMLQTFASLWEDGFQGKLSVVGGGAHFFYPKMMDMGQYASKKYEKYVNDGRLSFAGHIEPAQIRGRLSQAHAIIVPSTVDNLPYTVLEAMSLGKIVLVSRQGGHAELIEHSVNGFLFSHEEKGTFEQAMNAIHSLSREEIFKIGTRARETILKECSYETVLASKRQWVNSLKTKRAIAQFPHVRPRERKVIEPAANSYKKSLLTVVIPFYNLGKYLEECVRSVLASDYQPIEVIIINDGSTEKDSLFELSNVEQCHQVKVFHRPNSGLSSTRNFGALQANGKYLAFLDADDTIDVTYYRKAIEILERYSNVSFVGCWAKYFGESDLVWPAFNPEPPYLLTHNTMNSSGVVFKTEHFLAVGGNDTSMVYGMEDYETVINLVKQGYHGVVIPEILWNYRIRRESMAQAFNRFSELYLYRLISHKHASFFGEYAQEVTNILNANGPGMHYKNPTRAGSGFDRLFSGHSKVINLVRRNKILRKIARSIYRQLSS